MAGRMEPEVGAPDAATDAREGDVQPSALATGEGTMRR